uniref:Biopterin-dependent aromatic amino acid hydroxylase family profile domain-containing protein n=1 Tax=Plectus sambesii TaxID=2011161 RepID=A0A914VX87_9BILA
SFSESRMDEFKKRFRRSGSLGIPFVPEQDMRNIQQTICEQEEGPHLLTVIITTPRSSESLTRVLATLKDPVKVQHIESREAHSGERDALEMLIQMEMSSGVKPNEVIEDLRSAGMEVTEIACTIPPIRSTDEQIFVDPGVTEALAGAPWFPKTIYDLDKCSKRVLMYGTDLDADHPGFKDAEYRKRRMFFADLALNYKQGRPVPRVEYTPKELETWSKIYRELRALHKKHACQEFLDNFALLERYCGYSEHNVPQLDDLSRFLKAKTGFRVRPVAGYLSSRDFLAALAFRVFNCTQYIRHHADPFYTPEPDCVHELMGHMALFADPDFAQFSQEIGLASLGACEEDLAKLATLYFFSIEFGLCRAKEPVKIDGSAVNGDSKSSDFKIYGAGLLSSIGELKHAIEDKPTILRFDPDRVIQQECLITTFQSAYFYTQDFEEAQQKLRMFTNSMNRPFVLRYNPYTESVEVLNNKRSLTLAVNSLRSDINLLASALHNIL